MTETEKKRFDDVFNAITQALHRDGDYVLLSTREAATREVLRVVNEHAQKR